MPVATLIIIIGPRWRRFRVRRALELAQQTPTPVHCVFTPVRYSELSPLPLGEKPLPSSPDERDIGLERPPPPWSHYEHQANNSLARANLIVDTEPVSKSSAELVVAAAESAQRKRSSTIGSVRSLQRNRSSTVGSSQSNQPSIVTQSTSCGVQKPELCHVKRAKAQPDANGRRGRKSVDPKELRPLEALSTVRISEEVFDAIMPVGLVLHDMYLSQKALPPLP